MRTGILVLIVALSGCGDTTGPVVEEENCRRAGKVDSYAVNGVKVDTSKVDLYELCIERSTYQLPQEVVNAGQ